MGSFFSSLVYPPAEDAASSEPSRVQAFHSSSEWNNYFNSIKNPSTQDSSKLVVIDFTASWCGPCKFIAPVFAELSNTYTDVSFVKIDVDELKDVAQQFSVQAMPTFVFLKNGKRVDEVVGANKDELKRKIEVHRV